MRVTDSERAFLHELHAIKKDPLGKRLIHFAVSLAPKASDMTRRMESATNFIKKSFSKSPYCMVFSANNNDLFVAYSHISISDVLCVCSRVEKLFCDEAIGQRNAYNEYAFFKVADAVKELDKVFAAFKLIIADSQPDPKSIGKKPMTPDHLHALSEKLRTADLRHCIFNQPVFFVGQKVPSIEFIEFYVSSQQIESNFLPEVSLVGNPWLFHALKEDFDRATLRAVAREIPEYRHKAFSLNVALTTVLAREFAEFYEKLPTKLAGRIILEIHKTDLVQNFNLMKDVKSLAEEKGLRICIDGLDWHDLEIFCLDRLRPDFVKVIWHNDLLSSSPEDLAGFVQATKKMGSSTQMIMARCDSPKAFPFARSLGISYVQGRLADQFFKSGMEL